MATTDTKQQFIELRANNVSYAKIAQQLEVSKTTLIEWGKDCKADITNLQAINLEALREQYYVSKEARITMFGEQLEAVRTELKKRDLTDVPTTKLVDMLTSLTEHLAKEETPVSFMQLHRGLYLKPPVGVETWDG